MRILVTAGNTQIPLDDVRVITNVFSGRTGLLIARQAVARGHFVSLLTSHPELAERDPTVDSNPAGVLEIRPYRTFDDLHHLMQSCITRENYDVIIHSAAVSDYRLAGTFVPDRETVFNTVRNTWETVSGTTGQKTAPQLIDVSSGKVKSNHSELWMRMLPTPKLIDFVREPWGFKGVLVKFKLEVGPTDEELIQIAEGSRRHSGADLIVANTYSGMRNWAFLGPVNGEYQQIERGELATRLLNLIESKQYESHSQQS